MEQRGKLIVIEGISGSGKSTLANEMLAYMTSLGIDCVYNHGACTRTATGQQFKEITRDQPSLFSTSYYVADLVQDYLQYVQPLLNRGVTVIQDRYIHSIITYVKAYSKVEHDTFLDISPVIECYLGLDLLAQPDMNILCYADLSVIQERLLIRPAHRQKAYLENYALLEDIQHNFLELAHEGDYITYNSTTHRSLHDTVLKEKIESLFVKNNVSVGE